MNEKTKEEVFHSIDKLEKQLESILESEEKADTQKMFFSKETQRLQKNELPSMLTYLRNSPILALLTSPIIYAVLIPMILLDISVTIYQWIIFPINKIEIVKRKDFFNYDRFNLKYINILERFACAYCNYMNGLLAYVLEVTGRTEQNFCPIKDPKKRKYHHTHYNHFVEYGDYEGYREKLVKLRKMVTKPKKS